MPPATMLSAEKIQDSSNEESESPEARLKSKSKPGHSEKTPKTKSTAIDSLIEKNSSDESDTSDSSSKSSGSSAGAGSKRKAVELNVITPSSPTKKLKTSLKNVKRVESAAYVPPQGYTANKMQSTEIPSQAQGIFKDLDGKQIWQFSAPASFPISKLESLNVQAALSGESVLRYKGTSYTMSQGDSGQSTLLMPKPNGDYVRAATVSRVFNIRGESDTTTRLENGTIEDLASSHTRHRDENATATFKPEVFFATQTGQKKAPREQPENLRARYIPYGVVGEVNTTDDGVVQGGDATMADVSPEPVASSQIHSQATPRSSKKSKTKKTQSPEVTVAETPSKRKKEKYASSSSQVELLENDSSQKKRKEKSKK